MKKHSIILLVCLLPLSLWAVDMGERYGGVALKPSVRDLGSGEAFTVVPEVDNVIYNNPAGLHFVKLKMSLPEITWIFNNDFFKTLNYIVKNQDKLQLMDSLGATSDSSKYAAADDLRKSIAPIEGKWVRMGLSTNLSLSFKNFGVGVYTHSILDVQLDQGIYSPKVFAKAFNDVVVTAGASKWFFEKMSIGASVNMIERRATGLLKFNPLDFNDKAQIVSDIMGKVNTPVYAMSVTPGVIWPLMQEKVKLGMALQDVLFFRFNKDDDERDVFGNVTPNIKVGASYNLPLKEQTYFIRHVKFGVAVDDLLNLQGNNYLMNTHLGAEMKLLPCFARIGFNGGLPSFGVGCDLWAVRGDYVFFGKERGSFPGQDPSWNHMLSLRIGW
jgi:hypothetical protein